MSMEYIVLIQLRVLESHERAKAAKAFTGVYCQWHKGLVLSESLASGIAPRGGGQRRWHGHSQKLVQLLLLVQELSRVAAEV